MKHRRLAVVPALLLLTAAGCAPTATTTGQPRPRPAEFIVIDADAHGAVIADVRRAAFLGADRNGAVVWRAPQDTTAPDVTGCARRCPDALLSGNSGARNDDAAAGPAPALIRGGHREPVRGAALAGRTVLTADGADDYIVTGGTPGRWSLDTVRPGAPPTHVPVPGPHASWTATADRRHGLAVAYGTDPSAAVAVWFTRTRDGWRPDPATTPVTGTAACLAPGGDRAIVLGDRPAVRAPGGPARPVTGLDLASDCAFAASGGIVGAYGQDAGGETVRVEVFGPTGAVVRHIESRHATRVTGDPLSNRVAYTAGGRTVEVDTVTGDIVRTTEKAFGARYDGSGNLVTVDANGVPRWLPAT
ncbi:hypothetical protein [Actinoplanes utahensis]|uniref:Lipoprotein n=1 Tax=Actinoplanes utahensis TaxID=1869 RepID=A0A0A6UTV2_ACTUT|nr:hypothetical protein [Actinoplanes utahensis]KHD77874.1 hypothetical protein MB27_08830 [Actinoplanes utahensis]GIF32437.1 hypothetical protein Aut01nite_54230 [Actinoplanes utahensis]